MRTTNILGSSVRIMTKQISNFANNYWGVSIYLVKWTTDQNQMDLIKYRIFTLILKLCWNIPPSQSSPFPKILGDVKLNLRDNEALRSKGWCQYSRDWSWLTNMCSGPSWALWTTSVTPSPSPCSGAWCTGQSGTHTPSIRSEPIFQWHSNSKSI